MGKMPARNKDRRNGDGGLLLEGGAEFLELCFRKGEEKAL
jgi:hypothetical protein